MARYKSELIITDEPSVLNTGTEYHSTTSINTGEMDKKTKQPVFFRCSVCILGRKRLHKGDSFNTDEAEKVLKTILNKRQSHCMLYMLEDSIRFEKNKWNSNNPFRNFVRYEHIMLLHLPTLQPEHFILGVQSGRHGKCSYEAYKCKSRLDAARVGKLCTMAKNDSAHILRNLIAVENIPRQPISRHSVITEYDNSRDSIFVGLEDQENMQREASAAAYKRRSQGVKTITVPKSTYKRTEVELLLKEMEEWDEPPTFIYYDPVKGPKVDKSGPIYLYAARYPHQSQN